MSFFITHLSPFPRLLQVAADTEENTEEEEERRNRKGEKVEEGKVEPPEASAD
jgi:hypothetical protein